MKAKVALITDVCFWREGGGAQARTSAMTAYLNRHTELVILYAGLADPDDAAALAARYGHLQVAYLSPHERRSNPEYAGLIRAYLLAHPADACILEYAASTFLLEYLPAGLPAILNTHDLMSDRKQSYGRYNAPYGTLDVSEAEELALFRQYAYVLLIQENEYHKVRGALGEKALLAPHPVVLPQSPLRPGATRIGYVAGASEPNLDAIAWFLRDVWPAVYRPGISLHIYGGISDMLRWNSRPQQQPGELEATFPGITHFYESRSLDIGAQPGVVLHGFVPHLEQVYTHIDIAINPVRFGSGLKIKNMEALGCGIPLLTTLHGAGGLEAHVGQALLVADEPAGFAVQLNQLLDSYPLRQALGTAAYQLVRTRFSPEACFGGLLAAIHALSHSPHTPPPQCSRNY